MVPVQNIVPPVRTDPCRMKHETIKHHKQAENSYLNILVDKTDVFEYIQASVICAENTETCIGAGTSASPPPPNPPYL